MAKALQTNDIGYTDNTNLQPQGIELSLEAQIFLAFKYNTRNRRKILKTLLRAGTNIDKQLTDKTKFISPKAVEIANVVLNKLIDGKEVLLSHKYLSKITFCQSSAQNNNIVNELAGLFDIKYHRFLYKNGHIFQHNIEFTISASIINELRNSAIEFSEFYPKKISSSYINNKNIINYNKNRSNVHTHESNFCNFSDDSNSLVKPEPSILAETKNAVTIEKHNQKAIIHSLKHKKPRPSTKIANKRKKLTSAVNTAKKGRLLRFKQYAQAQNLAYHYPLTAEDASELQSKSTRYFNLNAQNEILLAISKKPSLQDHKFHSKAQFMVYMGKVLLHEMRDAEKTANSNYYIKANQTEERITHAQREAYLSKVEQQAMVQVSPENQLKAKLANTLAFSKAYNLLSGLSKFQLVGDIMEIHLNSCIDLMENDKNIVLSQLQAVYENVEVVKFIVQGAGLKACNSNIQQSKKSESLQLPQGVWGEVSKELVARYGVDIYKSWFSKLDAEIDEKKKRIKLLAPSDFIKDWVQNNYQQSIDLLVRNAGFELESLSC